MDGLDVLNPLIIDRFGQFLVGRFLIGNDATGGVALYHAVIDAYLAQEWFHLVCRQHSHALPEFGLSKRTQKDPPGEFVLDAAHHIDVAKNVRFGLCFYDAVRIRRDGKLTLPSGEILEVYDEFVFIPELKIRMTPSYPHSGRVQNVRIRSETDGSHWPFDENPARILHN